VQAKNSRAEGVRPIEVAFTDKPVSGWGGLLSIGRFFDALGVREALAQALPDGRTSNNQIPVVDMVMQLIATVLCGGSRFEHVERVRVDAVVMKCLRATRFGSASAITTYLGNIVQSQCEQMHQVLNQLVFKVLLTIAGSDVLDLDSTVFDRYGKQQGSAKGYHPSRPGRKSHHPLLAMFAKTKIIAHAWLRSGAASPHRGCREFMIELLAQLPADFRISAVRADSGFFSNSFLALLEERALPYTIRMKMTQPTAKWCSSLKEWRTVSTDVEITEGQYWSQQAGKHRRAIVIREAVRRESKGVLFEIVDYEYSAIVTTLDAEALEVWRFYNGRGDCENRIKELKHDFNAAGFCLQSFAGTEAAFRLTCFTFNLVALFKTLALQDRRTTLATIRNRIFVVGAAVGSAARKTILRLALQGRWRAEFERLLRRVAQISSTSAELAKTAYQAHFDAPSPWRRRLVVPYPAALY
jgi:hypothetical protein